MEEINIVIKVNHKIKNKESLKNVIAHEIGNILFENLDSKFNIFIDKKKVIVKDEDYQENKEFDPLNIDEPSGDDNLHFCENHNKMFLGED